MIITAQTTGGLKKYDTQKGIEISIPLNAEIQGPNCFYAPPFDCSPLVSGDFVGDTRKGGSVNFFDVKLNPHGNGTHTECVGHISKERVAVTDVLRDSFFDAVLVSVYPEKAADGDKVISAQTLRQIADGLNGQKAIIIRTMPNPAEKARWMYSGTNPCYFDAAGIGHLIDAGIDHLLTDLPSIDREEDGGAMAAHKKFWHYPELPAMQRTITEMIFVPDTIKDGEYLVQIQIPPFIMDAAPSRVFLYQAQE